MHRRLVLALFLAAGGLLSCSQAPVFRGATVDEVSRSRDELRVDPQHPDGAGLIAPDTDFNNIQAFRCGSARTTLCVRREFELKTNYLCVGRILNGMTRDEILRFGEALPEFDCETSIWRADETQALAAAAPTADCANRYWGAFDRFNDLAVYAEAVPPPAGNAVVQFFVDPSGQATDVVVFCATTADMRAWAAQRVSGARYRPHSGELVARRYRVRLSGR